MGMKFAATIGLLLMTFLAHAQSLSWCGTKDSPKLNLRDLSSANLRSNDLYIPVVVHVVLPEDGPEVTNHQIFTQIDALNENFGHFQDVHLIPSEFYSAIGLPRIEFCLATINPEGEEHEGITRTTTDIPFIGQHIFSDGRQSVHYELLGGQDAWAPTEYLNIWVAPFESIAGRSSFPGVGPPQEDGVVIDPSFFGKVGHNNSRFSEGRTLVHEIGHYLNLQHPWVRTGCDDDDDIDDTPIQDSPYFGCVSPKDAISCGTLDMSQNFMQFGQDPCLLYFSKGQVKMMQSILGTERSHLIENGRLQCTGDRISTSSDIKIIYQAGRNTVSILGLSPGEEYSVRIFGISGQMQSNFRISGRYTTEINTFTFPKGIYIIRVKGAGELVTQKIPVIR
jgi:hypothetical protein